MTPQTEQEMVAALRASIARATPPSPKPRAALCGGCGCPDGWHDHRCVAVPPIVRGGNYDVSYKFNKRVYRAARSLQCAEGQ